MRRMKDSLGPLFKIVSRRKSTRLRVLLASTTIVVGSACTLASPYMVRLIVDKVLLGSGSIQELVRFTSLLLLLAIVGSVTASIGQRLAASVSARILHDTRVAFFTAALRIPLSKHDGFGRSDLLSRLTSDTGTLCNFLSNSSVQFFPSIIQIICTFAIIVWMDWRLAMLVLVPSALSQLLATKFYRRIPYAFDRLQRMQSVLTTRSNALLSNIKLLKTSSREDCEDQRFANVSEELKRASERAGFTLANTAPYIQLIQNSGTYIVWIIGGMLVLKGQISLGTLMAFLSYLMMLQNPLGALLVYMRQGIASASAAANRLVEVIGTSPEKSGDSSFPRDPEVDISGIRFGYKADIPVINGVDLTIQPGQCVALIGPSGAGKTTLAMLMLKLYEVWTGTVRYEGISIDRIKLNDLRSSIGFVPQDVILLNGTLAENIAFSPKEPSPEQIIEASIQADALDFILCCPDAFDTVVGERGMSLSGGQIQRIGIARAIVTNPSLLILDEATSNVDIESAIRIRAAFRLLSRNRTTLLISHKLADLAFADSVAFMEDGKISAFGTLECVSTSIPFLQKLLSLEGGFGTLEKVRTMISAHLARQEQLPDLNERTIIDLTHHVAIDAFPLSRPGEFVYLRNRQGCFSRLESDSQDMDSYRSKLTVPIEVTDLIKLQSDGRLVAMASEDRLLIPLGQIGGSAVYVGSLVMITGTNELRYIVRNTCSLSKKAHRILEQLL